METMSFLSSPALIALLAAGVSFVAYPLYIMEFMGWRRSRVTAWLWGLFGMVGDTRPRTVSWIVWALLQLIIFASAYQEGAGPTNCLPLAHFAGSALTAIFAAQYGEGTLTKLDSVCGVLAVVCLSILVMVDSPWWALVLALLTEMLAGLPTLVGVIKHPQDESLPGWSMFFLGGILNLLALDSYTLEHLSFKDAGYTMYIMLFTGFIAVRLWVARWAPVTGLDQS